MERSEFTSPNAIARSQTFQEIQGRRQERKPRTCQRQMKGRMCVGGESKRGPEKSICWSAQHLLVCLPSLRSGAKIPLPPPLHPSFSLLQHPSPPSFSFSRREQLLISSLAIRICISLTLLLLLRILLLLPCLLPFRVSVYSRHIQSELPNYNVATCGQLFTEKCSRTSVLLVYSIQTLH